jgi:hypothetical protein
MTVKSVEWWDERRTENDLEGSGRRLIMVLSHHLLEDTEENHINPVW